MKPRIVFGCGLLLCTGVMALLQNARAAEDDTLLFGTTSAHPGGGTALIRPATDQENTRPKGNAFIHAMNNPFGNRAGMLSIATAANPDARTNVGQWQPVRVAPGSYVVSAQCSGSRFRRFDVPIRARADHEYLIECYGNTPITTKVHVRDVQAGGH